MSDNAYINDLEERLAEAEKKIAQLEAFDAANKAAIERSWTFTPEHLAKVRNDPVSITDRLRGNYGGRSFPASAICVVAADMLDEAKAQLTAANATIAACKEWTPASTPPSDSRFVLVWAPGYDVRLATYRPDIHEGYPWRSDTNHNCGVFFTPTHWKEVPPTPAAAKEAQ